MGTGVAPAGVRVDRGADGEIELVARAAAGDEGAFARLHAAHHRLVASLVRAEMRRDVRDRDAEDVVQEVFALAWQRLRDLRDPSCFRSWLLQIARRAVIDHARRTARRPALDGDPETIASAADVSPGPDEVTELVDLAGRLRGALAGLSRRDATAITLAAQFGMGPAEIGAALGITPGNAKVVLHRARARLRAAVG